MITLIFWLSKKFKNFPKYFFLSCSVLYVAIFLLNNIFWYFGYVHFYATANLRSTKPRAAAAPMRTASLTTRASQLSAPPPPPPPAQLMAPPLITRLEKSGMYVCMCSIATNIIIMCIPCDCVLGG